MANLADKIRSIRKLKKLTQEEVAKIIGTTQSYYNRLEAGKITISESHLASLEKAFSMSPKEIVDWVTLIHKGNPSTETQSIEKPQEVVIKLEVHFKITVNGKEVKDESQP